MIELPDGMTYTGALGNRLYFVVTEEILTEILQSNDLRLEASEVTVGLFIIRDRENRRHGSAREIASSRISLIIAGQMIFK